MSSSRTQHSAAGQAHTRNPSVSSQAFDLVFSSSHINTILDSMMNLLTNFKNSLGEDVISSNCC